MLHRYSCMYTNITFSFRKVLQFKGKATRNGKPLRKGDWPPSFHPFDFPHNQQWNLQLFPWGRKLSFYITCNKAFCTSLKNFSRFSKACSTFERLCSFFVLDNFSSELFFSCSPLRSDSLYALKVHSAAYAIAKRGITSFSAPSGVAI